MYQVLTDFVEENRIKEFSIYRTTLEQVFCKFITRLSFKENPSIKMTS